jgi:hypothetical protein
MILNKGDKILVVHRRLYENDEVLFFIGNVDDYDAGIVKSTGHAFLWDQNDGLMIQKDRERTKILSLSSGTLLVHQLAANVAFEGLKFEMVGGSLTLTDGNDFKINLVAHL